MRTQPILPGITVSIVAFNQFDRQMTVQLDHFIARFRKTAPVLTVVQFNALIAEELEENRTLPGMQSSSIPPQ